MNGVICENIGKLVYLDDLPEPEPQRNSAIVQIRRVGICGTDYHAYRGKQPFFSYPKILGHELVGEIVKIDTNTQGLEVGDKVSVIPYLHCQNCQACNSSKTNCCENMNVFGVHVDGGMRERVTIPINQLVKVNSLTLDEAVIIEPLAIGAHAIARSGLKSGQTALVIGAGPIGLGIMALINSMGAYAIAMDVNEERLNIAKVWGKAIYSIKTEGDVVEDFSSFKKDQLPSIVFDATGNEQSMIKAFDYTPHGGTLVYVGLFSGDITFHDPDFHRKELTLMGSRNATKQDFDTVIKLIELGHIKADQYITHRCQLEQLTEMFEYWINPKTKIIKAIVEL